MKNQNQETGSKLVVGDVPTPWKEAEYDGLIDANGKEICWYTTDDDGVHFKPGALEKIIRAVYEREHLLGIQSIYIELRKSHEALLAAAKHWSVCDFPQEIRFRCEGCVKAEKAIVRSEEKQP